MLRSIERMLRSIEQMLQSIERMLQSIEQINCEATLRRDESRLYDNSLNDNDVIKAVGILAVAKVTDDVLLLHNFSRNPTVAVRQIEDINAFRQADCWYLNLAITAVRCVAFCQNNAP